MLKLVAGTVTCVASDKILALTNRVCPYHKFLYLGQCLDTCPAGTYRRKYYTDDCAACSIATPGCFDCVTETSVCNTCHPVYKSFSAGTCYNCGQNTNQCCNYGFGWTTSGVCSACTVPGSLDCLTPVNSILCDTGTSKVLNSLGTCASPITSCNSYNFDASVCTQCSLTTLYNGASCVASCSAGTYPYFSNSNKICSACHPYCTACSAPGLSGKCSACQSGGYYPVTGGCVQCDNFVNFYLIKAGCSTWTTTGSAPYCLCTACQPGYLSLTPVQNPATTNVVCVTDCPLGYYNPIATTICNKCANCDICSGPNPSDCAVANACTLMSDTPAKKALVISPSYNSDATYLTSGAAVENYLN